MDTDGAAAALGRAHEFTAAALQDVTAAGRTGWESAAADRFREESGRLARLLARDLDAVGDTLGQVRGLL